MATSAEQLCEKLPGEFTQYMQEVKAIPNGGCPDYEQLRSKFQRLAARESISYDNVFDWTIRQYFETEQAGRKECRSESK